MDLSVSQSTAQRGFYKFIPLAFPGNAFRICYEIRPPTGETAPLSNPADDFLRPGLNKEVNQPGTAGLNSPHNYPSFLITHMLGLNLGLNLKYFNEAGGVTPLTHSAYVDADLGDDLTAQLNDVDLPFITYEAAEAALVAEYPGERVTVLFKTTYSSFYVSIDKLTLKGYNIPRTIAQVLFNAACELHVYGQNLTITELVISQDGHVITGFNAVVETISANGSPGSDGGFGNDGENVTGANGSSASDEEFPNSGQSGQSVYADGQPGSSGLDGTNGFSFNLLGSGAVTTLNIHGGNAGAGGAGGDGGFATGGNGGNGGNATGPSDSNGGNGGNGGNASAIGGDGAPGGNGGNGGLVTASASWTITNISLVGGTGGAGGAGGVGGSATGGSAGVGGTYYGSGSNGSDGQPGPAIATDGANGSAGSSGTDGSVTVI